MRGKNKSLLEDVIILFVGVILIYFIYSFFFSSNDEESKETITITENKIENNSSDSIKKEELIVTSKAEEKIEDKIIEHRPIIENRVLETVKKEEAPAKVEEKIVEVEKPNIIQTPNNITTNISITNEKKIEQKEIEKPSIELQNKDLDEKTKVDIFYKTIKEQIYLNIDRTVDKNLTKKGEFVNFRLTILKDGRYEQLTFIEGNKENFELLKSSISQTFPVNINDQLKNSFPRYFRMKVEF